MQGVPLARRFALVPLGPPLLSYSSTAKVSRFFIFIYFYFIYFILFFCFYFDLFFPRQEARVGGGGVTPSCQRVRGGWLKVGLRVI
jgi:hypothetical protein